jgi:short-subunit dehydrogenase
MSTYPASKAAISFYSDTLADEFGHTNVKIQCLIPLLVATNLASYNSNEANDIFVVKANTFARYAVNIIGRFRLSTGCFAHDMQVSLDLIATVFKQLFPGCFRHNFELLGFQTTFRAFCVARRPQEESKRLSNQTGCRNQIITCITSE